MNVIGFKPLKLVLGRRAELILQHAVRTAIKRIAGHDSAAKMESLQAGKDIVELDVAPHERIVNSVGFRTG